jgi:uncharacterized protein YjbJ (UPF0337 family)
MSERFDELKGNIEAQYGKMRKDDDMQATGAANAQEARLQRKVEGAIEAAAGSVEEYLGAQGRQSSGGGRQRSPTHCGQSGPGGLAHRVVGGSRETRSLSPAVDRTD